MSIDVPFTKENLEGYPTVVKQDNVNDVIAATLKKKRQKQERERDER